MNDTGHIHHSWIFPDPETADADGLLAAGGDLEPSTLLEAYAHGIFPWYSEGTPVLWWCPDPRMVLFPDHLKVSKSLGQSVRNKGYRVLLDTDFTSVIQQCACVPRNRQGGTWITPEMERAYIRLHREGYAHSAETYLEGRLVGGLYGVSLGGIFFGESMFHKERDASKVALYHLVQLLKEWDFDLIDIQQSTTHMHSLGAEEIPRSGFLELIHKSLKKPTRRGNWQ
jgi:leucyl/phenylalanyl-tRNA--protein transferase